MVLVCKTVGITYDNVCMISGIFGKSLKFAFTVCGVTFIIYFKL